MDKNITSQLKEKYEAIDQNLGVHLEGLLYSKPITYWDYIHTDALLNLQIQRTTLPDEMVFIGYHQINELIFKVAVCSFLFHICHAITTGIKRKSQKNSGFRKVILFIVFAFFKFN